MNGFAVAFVAFIAVAGVTGLIAVLFILYAMAFELLTWAARVIKEHKGL